MSLNLSVTGISSNTTADNGYDVYFIDASSNNVTLSLPTDYDGKAYFIKRQPLGGGNLCTVDTTDSATIDGASSVSLGDGGLLKVIKFNGNWVTFL